MCSSDLCVKNKFSGSPDSVSLIEFLNALRSGQEYAKLSVSEFLEVMRLCTTGRAHTLLLEWLQVNGEDIETIFYNLHSQFDTRMSPSEAKRLLHFYKVPAKGSLSEAINHISSLASRSASELPDDHSRRAYYNLESVQCLIRALPPTSSALVSNTYHSLSAKLKEPCPLGKLEIGRAHV